jgi:Flp pilus assembly protein TadB
MNDPVPVKSQAEAMLERVSPEGRARALKEQRKRQQARMRIVGRCLLASLLVALALAAVNAWLMPATPAILAAAVAILALAWAVILY